MVNYWADALWPWLRFGTSGDTLGMAPDGASPAGLALMAGAYRSPNQAAIPVGSGGEFGLSNWRPPDSNPFAPNTMSVPARGPDLAPPWFHPQGRDETIPPALNSPWVGGEPEDDPSGFRMAPDGTSPTRIALMASAYHSPGQAMTPGDVGNELGLSNWRPPETNPFTQDVTSLPAQEPDSQPPWFRPVGTDEKIWPWLRAEPEDVLPSFRLNTDGSIEQSDPSARFELTSAAYSPSDDPAATDAGRFTQAEPDSLDLLQRTAGVGGTLATAAATPMDWTADAVIGSQGIRNAISELAALARRAAPMAARAVTGPAAALPVLVLPANSGDETISLGDGLRARRVFQQRTVEIERRVDNGLLGIGARWEKLPVTAAQIAGEDGAPRVMIDGHELEKTVGPEAAARAWDAIGSAMARPPKKKDDEDQSEQPSGTESKSSQTQDQGGGNRPPTGPDPLTTAAEVTTRALENADKPRSDPQEQAELIEGWRQILKSRGEQAPDGQYRDEGGYMTALGVRMPPDVGEPAAGRDAYPKQEHLRKGVIGEFELVNRIKAVRPDEVIVHFGNAPGAQGPDVLSVGRDRLINIWDSKSRSDERSVGQSMAASANLDRRKIEAYVWKAVSDGRLSHDVAFEALQKFYDGNYNILTVGTNNAHDGLAEFFRNRKSSGPRRH